MGSMHMHEIRHFLRAATRDEHARVDAVFSRFDLNRRDGYGGFLSAQARVLPGLEAKIAKAGLWDAWAPRTPFLSADLVDLGLAVETPSIEVDLPTDAELWGALYVVEGSRLGGAVLAGRVSPDFPKRFLLGGGPGWLAFQDAMAGAPSFATATGPAELLAGARKTFAPFEAAGLAELGDDIEPRRLRA